MQIDHLPSRDGATVSVLTLDNKRERALTDDELARVVANHAGVRWDPRGSRYRVNGRRYGPRVADATVKRIGTYVAIVTALS